jgi:3-deoxy-D-manno-octulosonate 8-phosphate phosphatase (KDO 8-P phosphatase)
MLDPSEFTARLARTRLLVLDVDGVLTDGRVLYGAESAGAAVRGATLELQAFDVKDGLGLNLVRRAGVTLAWITGRGCDATRRRAEELGVEELHMRARGGKLEVLLKIQRRLGISADETVAMGDDLFDLAMAKAASVFGCPSDAHDEVRARADWVALRPGGRGAVRELTDAILVAQGKWDATLADLIR